MRRGLAVAVAILVLLGVFAPPSSAQAPTPKVTINGLIDTVAASGRNASQDITNIQSPFQAAILGRGGATDRRDTESYGRIRARWDIIGELLKAKAVLGLELDTIFGQTAISQSCTESLAVFAGCRPDGSTASFPADNDVRNNIEIKWSYISVPATGPGSLLPFVPFEGQLDLGGQPFALGTTKFSLLADSDFAGATYRVKLSPTVSATVLYAQWEERSTGQFNGFFRGDDWGTLGMLTITPMKGLRIMPIYAFQELSGTTSRNIRTGTGGYPVDAPAAPNPLIPRSGAGGMFPSTASAATAGGAAGAGATGRPSEELRHTIGIDSRLDIPPFYVSPTFFYQFGTRDRTTGPSDPGAPGFGFLRTADISAFIVDTTAGWRRGPLLLEFRGMYASGNNARDNLNNKINYYQPFQSGNAYFAGWGEATAISLIDYLTIYNGPNSTYAPTRNYGYDRYGMYKFVFKATYGLTPALSFYGWVSPQWTAESVDTNTILTNAGRANPLTQPIAPPVPFFGLSTPQTRANRGRENYFGTELTGGLTWRFAPGLAFDAVYSYFFAGPAQDALSDTGIRRFDPSKSGTAGAAPFLAPVVPSTAATNVFRKFSAEDTYLFATRVRFAF